MNRSVIVLLIWVSLFMTPIPALSQQGETRPDTSRQLAAPEDTLRPLAASPTGQPDDSPLVEAERQLMFISMGFLMLSFLAFGLTLAVALLFLLFAFTAWGVLSTAVLLRLYERSLRKDFRILLLLVGGVLGAVESTVGWWILVWRFRLPENGLPAYLLAASTGLLAGLLLGLMTEWIAVWLLGFFKRQLFDK